ncbi:PP2C family protein-serine/threonine phosphatase [Sphingomonas sp.]|uniref:PP2C family protein-serine/threonine phosphatase n=1 Tax=Sphingomonas sp. TaxID=28214 RepID=UPI002DD624E0|nr:protein phosphatase 2C domain-containing protein [Sphingomonas sp.]
MSPGPKIEATARSHEGRVRTNNEDAFCDRTGDGLWAVADGMGGHEFGERASAAIVEALSAAVLPEDLHAACEEVSQAIHRANATIWSECQASGVQSGSTVVSLLIRGTQFAVLWVGDSRAYLLRDGALYLLSRDHTQVQEMVDRGLLTEAEAEGHPMSHVLARAVGVRDYLEIEAIVDEIAPGDIFLLCSDGLSGVLNDHEIAAQLRLADSHESVERLIAKTLERGAPDNVTTIVVATREPTLVPLAPLSQTVYP